MLHVGLQDRANGAITSITGSQVAGGCIIDSGTTDTYLPKALAPAFSAAFKKITGVAYTATANIVLKQEDLARIPNLVFTLAGAGGANETTEVELPWSNYLDAVGNGKYALRVYPTEAAGFILGANLMTGYNVIFDADGTRVGFAKSNCKYDDFIDKLPVPPSREPLKPSKVRL